jgi:hypothetical protein
MLKEATGIRVQRGLREQFLDACRMQDKPASQVLREFMRDYVAEHSKNAGWQRREEGRHELRVCTGRANS